MKKIFLLSLGALGLLALAPTPSQADDLRVSIEPGSYDRDAYYDGHYHHGPRYYPRYYRHDDRPSYVYRNGRRYHRVHRWHDDDGR